MHDLQNLFLQDVMDSVLRQHNAIFRAAAAHYDGYEVLTEGDRCAAGQCNTNLSFCIVGLQVRLLTVGRMGAEVHGWQHGRGLRCHVSHS